VQAGTKLLPEKSDNPFDELFKEISKSAYKITEKIRSRLNEADVHVDQYIDNLKENVENTNVHFQEILQKVSLYFLFIRLKLNYLRNI